MNNTTKQLDKLLTNVINLIKSGSFTDAQVIEIYTTDTTKCEITRNEDGTYNAKVSVPNSDGLILGGWESMEERNIS